MNANLIENEFDGIIIVDDVVTRGATIMGAAARLREAFPNARIRAFTIARAGAMSTMGCAVQGAASPSNQMGPIYAGTAFRAKPPGTHSESVRRSPLTGLRAQLILTGPGHSSLS